MFGQWVSGSPTGLLGWVADDFFLISIQRGMLAQLAARLRERQDGGGGGAAAAAGDGNGHSLGVVLEEDGETLTIDDNCSMQ